GTGERQAGAGLPWRCHDRPDRFVHQRRVCIASARRPCKERRHCHRSAPGRTGTRRRSGGQSVRRRSTRFRGLQGDDQDYRRPAGDHRRLSTAGFTHRREHRHGAWQGVGRRRSSFRRWTGSHGQSGRQLVRGASACRRRPGGGRTGRRRNGHHRSSAFGHSSSSNRYRAVRYRLFALWLGGLVIIPGSTRLLYGVFGSIAELDLSTGERRKWVENFEGVFDGFLNDIVLDAARLKVYASAYSGQHEGMALFDLEAGTVEAVSYKGDGKGDDALFGYVASVAFDPVNEVSYLLVRDAADPMAGIWRIWRVDRDGNREPVAE